MQSAVVSFWRVPASGGGIGARGYGCLGISHDDRYRLQKRKHPILLADFLVTGDCDLGHIQIPSFDKITDVVPNAVGRDVAALS